MKHHIHDLPLQTAPPVDVAWLAGLLEGEGCFYAGGRNKKSGHIALSMTDEDVVNRAAFLMGAHVRPVGPRSAWQGKRQYRTVATGVRARATMEAVLPYLGVRRARRVVDLLAMPTWGFVDSHARPDITRTSI